MTEEHKCLSCRKENTCEIAHYAWQCPDYEPATQGYAIECPYCKQVFGVSESKMYCNEYFKCPHCKRLCCKPLEVIKGGLLTGIKKPMSSSYVTRSKA